MLDFLCSEVTVICKSLVWSEQEKRTSSRMRGEKRKLISRLKDVAEAFQVDFRQRL